MNVTVPVGVPEPGDLAETVAVKVTDLPNLEVVEDDLIAVAVAAVLTVCVRGADVLLSKLVLPLKVAVMEWVPTDSFEVSKLLIPDLFTEAVPRIIFPSLKVTLPDDGTFFELVTVAVKRTVWPYTDGLKDEVTTVEVVLELAAAIVIDRVRDAVTFFESLTVKVALKVPAAAGVPEMMPVEVLRVIPAGRDPLVTDQVHGSNPPVSARVCE
jgi:hypothetical protein